jgi:hypothetical protein
MTKSAILKRLMTTFIIAAVVIFVIRSLHRVVMRSVEAYDYLPHPPTEHPRNDNYSYVGSHTDFKRRSKV